MVLFVIISYPDISSYRLVNWCKFHNINYVIIDVDKYEANDYPLDSRLYVYITNDLYPEPELLLELLKGQTRCCSEVKIYKPDVGNNWISSFCCVSSERIVIKAPSDLHGYAHRPAIASLQGRNETNLLALVPLTAKERMKTLWEMVSNYWYKIDSILVSRYFMHLYINAYQLYFLKGDSSKSNVTWLKSQSVFSTSFKRKHLGKLSEDDLLGYCEEGISLQECIDNDLQGYSAEVDLPVSRVSRHLLSLNGKLCIIPRKNSTFKMDVSTTVVSFYYDLGYAEKPQDTYLRSLEDFALIRHPVVFFSDTETCKRFRELREDVLEYTVCIDKPLQGWELIQTYTDAFQDSSIEDGLKKSKKYSILTCVKFWAIHEAIQKNYFLSKKYAWLDSGIFKHENLTSSRLVGIPLFSKVELDIDKVLLPAVTSSPGTTEEQFEDAVDNILAGVMVGYTQGWKTFLSLFFEMVRSRFDSGFFCTEQVVICRLVALYPEIAQFKPMTLDEGYLVRLLNLDTEVI